MLPQARKNLHEATALGRDAKGETARCDLAQKCSGEGLIFGVPREMSFDRSRVPDAMQRATLRRRAGTHSRTSCRHGPRINRAPFSSQDIMSHSSRYTDAHRRVSRTEWS